MDKDPQEKQYNPVIGVLERHDALELLIDPGVKLFPEAIGLCNFENYGLRYRGEFVSTDREIEIEYDTFPDGKQELLICTATAPLNRWINWQENFPEDFKKALICNSPYFQIDTTIPISLMQQITFSKSEIKRYLSVYTQINLGDEHITILKENSRPVIVDSDLHILRSIFNRRYF